jgi:glutamyl-tRNA synthetase
MRDVCRSRTDGGVLKAPWSEIPGGPDAASRTLDASGAGGRRLMAAIPGLKERAKTLIELLDSARYLAMTSAHSRMEPKAAEQLLTPEAARQLLAALRDRLGELEPWSTDWGPTAVVRERLGRREPA